MKNYLILHGHFYQPPRENPWTGIIPIQPSASPFKNWNLKIAQECYTANCYSRYLNQFGDIIDIKNNYEKLSFNFGPTLLNWLKEEIPETYKSIIEADKKSVKENNGHGNAIAQVYNHIILPLATDEEKRIQIEWGITDFISHFNRAPEGMWLSETAIDKTTIDCLIDANIKFVILSPWQAGFIKDKKSGDFKKIDNPLNISNKAYKIKGTKGYIQAFFYNHVLAQGISFNHYLWSADDLLNKIKTYQNKSIESNLIHTATDGEIYGHHEKNGDMCIAAITEKIKENDDIVFTNYGAYLEKFPATEEIILKTGEDDRGTSWSCEHGVSRWYKDCGCSTGSKENWNQKWRTPLRHAFDVLKKEIDNIIAEQIEILCKKPSIEILAEYGQVLSHQISARDFAKKVLSGGNEHNDSKLLTLLDGYKNALYMYTSCGWFFAEISGIEPVQNMNYALKAAEVFNKYTEVDLIEDLKSNLKKAKSNIKQFKDGEFIFNKFVINNQKSIGDIAALFIIKNYIGEVYQQHGFFNLANKLVPFANSGEIEIFNKYSLENFKLKFEISDSDKIEIKIYNNSMFFEISKIAIATETDFFMPKNIFINIVCLLKKYDNNFAKFFRILDIAEDIDIPDNIKFKSEELAIYKIETLLEKKSTLEELSEIDTFFRSKFIKNIANNPDVKKAIVEHITMLIDELTDDMDIETIKKINLLHEICDKNLMKIDWCNIQNKIFKLKPKKDKLQEYIKLSTQFKLYHFMKDIKN